MRPGFRRVARAGNAASGLVVMVLAAGACHRDAADEHPAGADPQSPSTGPRTDIPEYTVNAVARGSIVIDGALDDAGWASAPPTAAFVHPGNGEAVPDSPVAGRAQLAWDDENLYLAFIVNDAAPSSPNARDAVDPHVWESASGIELMLQPGDPGDNQAYFEVQVDVNEAVWDTRFDDYNAPITGDGPDRRFGHQDWSAALSRAVRVHEAAGAYTVEMALPWTSLGTARVSTPPASGDVWRANLYTFRDGQRAALAWSPLMGEGNFHRASRFGRLRFEADE